LFIILQSRSKVSSNERNSTDNVVVSQSQQKIKDEWSNPEEYLPILYFCLDELTDGGCVGSSERSSGITKESTALSSR
jgi:delta-aminolevulinic acid dehydratase/porphobilinogen synthase